MTRILSMRTSQRGFTLTELIIVVVIMGVLAALAVPSFIGLFNKNKLRGAVESLVSDLQNSRFEASKRNAKIYVSFSAGSNWCYGIGTGSGCDCTSSGTCDLRTVTVSDYPGVTITSSLGTNALNQYYEPTMGGFTGPAATCTPSTGCVGKITFTQSQFGDVEVQVSSLGRARACAPTSNASGYPVCQ